MMLSLDTAYRSFGGEVEASSTPTICRLPDSRRHQLWAIAQPTAEERGAGNPHATFCGSRGRATASGDPVGEEKSSSLPRPSGTGPVCLCLTQRYSPPLNMIKPTKER